MFNYVRAKYKTRQRTRRTKINTTRCCSPFELVCENENWALKWRQCLIMHDLDSACQFYTVLTHLSINCHVDDNYDYFTSHFLRLNCSNLLFIITIYSVKMVSICRIFQLTCLSEQLINQTTNQTSDNSKHLLWPVIWRQWMFRVPNLVSLCSDVTFTYNTSRHDWKTRLNMCNLSDLCVSAGNLATYLGSVMPRNLLVFDCNTVFFII